MSKNLSEKALQDFLESYIPNQSSYLGQKDLARMKAIGIAINPEELAPAGTYAKQILGRLLIELSWNSSRLEGNTYSLLDTQRLIEKGIAAQGKGAQEAQMILNHKAAIEFIVDSGRETGMNSMTIRNTRFPLNSQLRNEMVFS
jgi:Fic family protein